jgi:hypothetical protein
MGCAVIGQVSMLKNKTNKTTFLIVMDWLVSCELVLITLGDNYKFIIFIILKIIMIIK